MMFNGLMTYGDSDTSDFTKESVASSSVAGSAGSEARNHCLENKLSATLQVLKNKEETVRVQAESLALAEARIAALSARAQSVAHHTQPISLHSTRSSADGCCVETSDVTAQTQETDEMVSTLRDNLSVIEDLYRECFYETAKQEELISLLRQSCLDVRREERQKDARIGRLQSALCSHTCQNIVLEVENLKSEISNFLNSSNHDSGMWERAEEPLAGELADELHHISGQLLRLRDLLADGCSCGLEDENTRLRRINETLEMQLSELRQRVRELEAVLEDKENVDEHHQHQIQLKDQELMSLQQQLAALEAASAEHRTSCSGLHLQVQQLQVLLQDRSEELSRAQRHCEEHAATIGQLRLELGRASSASQETDQVRAEVSQLSAAVSQWRAQLADSRRRLRALADELQRERQHCAHLEHHYREKAQLAAELQTQLEEARARGAALCEEAQRAVCGVRRWLRRARLRHREQEQTIEEQESLIRTLQRPQRTDADAGPGGCSRCSSLSRDVRGSLTAGSLSDTSGRSALTPSTPPTPPRRSRRGIACDDRGCQWPAQREAGSQRPPRTDAHTQPPRRPAPSAASEPDHLPREVSPTDELLERVDRTHEALAEARRRWRLGTSFGDLRGGT